MGDFMIVAVAAVALVFAVRGMVKRGKNGCCGGGGSVAVKKTLEGEMIAQKVLTIEGMHCENCKNRVERQINKMAGAVAKVDLKRKIAVVSMSRMVEDEVLREAVERLDFKVLKIEEGRVA